jgi:hypothetical protein
MYGLLVDKYSTSITSPILENVFTLSSLAQRLSANDSLTQEASSEVQGKRG